VIIAPDSVRLDADLAARLRTYLAGGCSLLLSHESGLRTDGQGTEIEDWMGIEYLGPARDDMEFLRPTGEFEGEIPAMDHVMYERGSAVRAREGTTVLATLIPPYFSRTWEHFNSHAQTPPNLTAPYERDAITLRQRVAYVSQPIFRTYQLHGYPVYRQIVAALLRRLLPEPLVRANLPTTAEVTLLRQAADGDVRRERLVCHILHYVPQRRTPDLDLVEDVLPLHDVALAVRTDWTPREAYLAPERADLQVEMEGAYAKILLPRVDGHAIVVLER
jgi:hypothetical protein